MWHKWPWTTTLSAVVPLSRCYQGAFCNNSHKAEAPHRAWTEQTNGCLSGILKSSGLPGNAIELRSSAAVNEMWWLWNKASVSLRPHRGERWRQGLQKRASWGCKISQRNSNAPVFSLGLLSDVPWTAAKPFLCVQTEKTHTFALCFRASFSSILGGTYLSVHMGGLLWPQDTGLWTLVVVSMEMSRTWGGIQLTGNTVYCWLSGMGKEGGSVCGERRGGGWGWGWGLAPCWWNEDLNITVLLISQVRWDETKQRNPTGFSFFSVGIKKSKN